MNDDTKIVVQAAVEIDRGYWEFRVNWTAAALLAMTGEELERFQQAMATLQALAKRD